MDRLHHHVKRGRELNVDKCTMVIRNVNLFVLGPDATENPAGWPGSCASARSLASSGCSSERGVGVSVTLAEGEAG